MHLARRNCGKAQEPPGADTSTARLPAQSSHIITHVAINMGHLVTVAVLGLTCRQHISSALELPLNVFCPRFYHYTSSTLFYH